MILNKFENIYFYVRSDKVQVIQRNLENIGVRDIKIVKNDKIEKKSNIDVLLSQKEQIFYSLMQLCSTKIVKSKDKKIFTSLELFEYCGKNFIKSEDENNLSFGFQSFINDYPNKNIYTYSLHIA